LVDISLDFFNLILPTALDLVQLGRLDEFIQKRALVAEKYNKRFKDVEGVRVLYKIKGSPG
jgi:dTDP-4-amino-4,6-dideoxygalactose transaminase